MGVPSITRDDLGTTLDLGWGTVEAPGKSAWQFADHCPEVDLARVRFAGNSGSFAEHRGIIARKLELWGHWRGTSAELTAAKAAADAALAADDTTWTVVSDLGVPFENCVFDPPGIEIGPRQRVVDDATVDYRCPFRITLVQLEV